MNDLLLIFVKHPVAGKAKTRLAATLGHEKALGIYRELLTHTQYVAEFSLASKVVFYGNEMPEEDLWSQAGFWRYAQQGENLGDRMMHAFSWGFSHGFEKVVIIGSDNARLQPRHLAKAFAALDNKDTVLGPATDGGYYIFGMKEVIEEVFKNKRWSTDSVLKDTLADLDKLNKSYTLLEPLSDVDVEEDLKGTFLEKWLD